MKIIQICFAISVFCIFQAKSQTDSIEYCKGDYSFVLKYVQLPITQRAMDLKARFIEDDSESEEDEWSWVNDISDEDSICMTFYVSYLKYIDLKSLTGVSNDEIFSTGFTGYDIEYGSDSLFVEMITDMKNVGLVVVEDNLSKYDQPASIDKLETNFSILNEYFKNGIAGRISFSEYFFKNLKFSNYTYLIVKSDLETLTGIKAKNFYEDRLIDNRFRNAYVKWSAWAKDYKN